jgi:hypothetical protein
MEYWTPVFLKGLEIYVLTYDQLQWPRYGLDIPGFDSRRRPEILPLSNLSKLALGRCVTKYWRSFPRE